MSILYDLLEWFFETQQDQRTVWSTILWWEKRRLVYNLIVGTVGTCSLLLFFFFITQSGALKGGDDAVEPMALFAAPFLVNICYYAGALVEITTVLSHRESSNVIGPWLLKAGLYFSLGVVLLPSTLWFVFWVIHLFHH